MNRIDLQGRIAVVTGRARGIGLACARRMLESGARVVLWDRDEAALASVAAAFHVQDRIKVVAVDVSDSGSVDAAATATRDDTGRVDILVKSMGKELAGTGVLVNCVTPAAAKTDIFNQMTEQHIAYMLSKIPMGRFVETDEIAALMAWLCSDDCSFSTGAVFDISGGRATY